MTVYTVHCDECGDIYSSTIKQRAVHRRDDHNAVTGHQAVMNRNGRKAELQQKLSEKPIRCDPDGQ